MENIIINRLNELIKTKCKCCTRYLNMNVENDTGCVCCKSLKNTLESIIEVQITLLINQFNNLELKITGMKSSCESPELIAIECDKRCEIIKSLRPVKGKIYIHFPHLKARFDTINKRYDS